MSDPAEQVFRPLPPFPPSRENILIFLVVAVLIAVMVVFHASAQTALVLAVLAVIGLARKAWSESRGAFIVGPGYFGLIRGGGKRQVWPIGELGKIVSARRPGAFGRDTVYTLVSKDGRPLIKVRAAIMRPGELDQLWARLGVRP
jgi:hypothetical protein